jgi:predicted nucleic acid-binding protein
MPDSNVIVASIRSDHVHHHRASQALKARIAEGSGMVVAAHSMLESFSILTSLPAPFKMRPLRALAVITAFVESARLVSLTPDQYLALLASLPARGVIGGRTYDALVLETAEAAAVDELLTFNVRKFATLARTVTIISQA